jgi:hypothetical protein
MTEPARREWIESEVIKRKIAMSIVQVVWGGYSFNASPEQAAKRFVSDLYKHLSSGGSVTVRIEGLDGTELEVLAGR